jgi:Zn-dependent peptidase ImmA (M78 family)
MNSDCLTSAEGVLQSLGITEPKEIDLEAISWSLGVKVRFQPLDGCEARIMGKGDSAIITVNSRSHCRRQRFSIGHELGHWKKHRGQILVCRSDDIGNVNAKATSVERRADIFAADLLMPTYLFQPIVRDFRQLNFDTVCKISDIFDVSFPAAAIRTVEKGHHPAMLVCHNMHSRRWFIPSPLVPTSRWFPRDELQPESSAMDVLYGRTIESRIRKVPATVWFDSYEANRHEIWEQSRKIGHDEVLTLLLFKDPTMLL